MVLDSVLSPTEKEKDISQPQLPPRLQDFTETAEEIGKSRKFTGVLNTMPDARIDGYHPQKRIQLALGGRESPEESSLLASVGSDAAELEDTFANFNCPAKAMVSMSGPSNGALCQVVKATRHPSTVNSKASKSINMLGCVEEQDYIRDINRVHDYLDEINEIVRFGGSKKEEVLKAAVGGMEQVAEMLTHMLRSSSSALAVAHPRL